MHARGSHVYIYQPMCAPTVLQEATDAALKEARTAASTARPASGAAAPVATWAAAPTGDANTAAGLRVTLTLPKVREGWRGCVATAGKAPSRGTTNTVLT